MSVGKRVVPVVEVGAVPRHAEFIEPGGSEFGFKTFAEIAFGLGIEVDASSGIHTLVGSFSLILSGLGWRNGRGNGVAANTGLRTGAGVFTGAGCAITASLSRWGLACRFRCPARESGIARDEVGFGDLDVDLGLAQRFVFSLNDEIGVRLSTSSQTRLLAGGVVVTIPNAGGAFEGAVSVFHNGVHFGTEPNEEVSLQSGR